MSLRSPDTTDTADVVAARRAYNEGLAATKRDNRSWGVAIGFVFVMALALAMVMMFPEIALWLPDYVYGK